MDLSYLMIPFTSPIILALVAAGTFVGIYIGAIPGLSATMAVSLLVSLTFGWETNKAVAMMIGVFIGGVYGGSRSAILLNIPGAPAAVATALDGYPLAKKGLAGKAMGVATTQSFIGTVFGIIVLMFGAPFVAAFAMKFSSVDYMLLAFMGMMMVGSLGCKSMTRGIVAASLGIFLGTVGMDPLTAVTRFTFGNTYLNSGVNFIVALIGLFGAAEAISQMTEMGVEPIKQKIDRIIPSFSETKKYIPLTIRSAIVGVLVGALPGAGGDIAALLTYDQAKRTVRNPEVPFGEGAVEGIVAPETANNAAIGGAFIPMLTLGIPGDAVTAVLIGALTIHGLRPGPNLMTDNPQMFNVIVGCLWIGAICLLIFGLTGIKIFTKVVEIPKPILMPTILILSVIGSYAINNSLYDIFWMLGFGVLGYFMKRFDYPIGPMVLGVILCRLMETNLLRGLMLHGSAFGLILSIFKSPISVCLFALMIFLLATNSNTYRNWKKKRDEAKVAERCKA